MRANLIRVGNSRGVRIPKTFLKEAKLENEIEMEVRDSELVIRALNHPRAGWDKAFQLMAERGDDVLLDSDAGSLTRWDDSDWRW